MVLLLKNTMLFTRAKTDPVNRRYQASKLDPVNSAELSTWNVSKLRFEVLIGWNHVNIHVDHVGVDVLQHAHLLMRVCSDKSEENEQVSITDQCVKYYLLPSWQTSERRSEQFSHQVILPCLWGHISGSHLPVFEYWIWNIKVKENAWLRDAWNTVELREQAHGLTP